MTSTQPTGQRVPYTIGGRIILNRGVRDFPGFVIELRSGGSIRINHDRNGNWSETINDPLGYIVRPLGLLPQGNLVCIPPVRVGRAQNEFSLNFGINQDLFQIQGRVTDANGVGIGGVRLNLADPIPGRLTSAGPIDRLERFKHIVTSDESLNGDLPRGMYFFSYSPQLNPPSTNTLTPESSGVQLEPFSHTIYLGRIRIEEYNFSEPRQQVLPGNPPTNGATTPGLLSFIDNPDPEGITPVYYLSRHGYLHHVITNEAAAKFFGPNWASTVRWCGDSQRRILPECRVDFGRPRGCPITEESAQLPDVTISPLPSPPSPVSPPQPPVQSSKPLLILTPEQIRPLRFEGNGMYGYSIEEATVPMLASFQADSADAPQASRLILLENGIPLGPSHTLHIDIQNNGLGRYSHWYDGRISYLWFSTSDNTDPRSNGRIYAIAEVSKVATILPQQITKPNSGFDGDMAYSVDSTQLDILANYPADNEIATSVSPLYLFEDGILLRQAHSQHPDVARLGQGRYIHWNDRKANSMYLLFSTSDNTDPRTNGRTYTVIENSNLLPL